MQKVSVMLDLETMGKTPGCAILAIGAVMFRPTVLDGVVWRLGEIIDEFYARIDLQSCVDLGLTIDAGTVLWWLEQSSEARAEATCPEGRESLPGALLRFDQWVASRQGIKKDDGGNPVHDKFIEVWGNGSDFDNVILEACYRAVNIPLPWDHFGNRCYRTLKNQFPGVKLVRAGTHHNALDDARCQARHLMAMLDGKVKEETARVEALEAEGT